ncbi:MAG: acetyl-CoA C-acetyltransferase [Desulfitobacteriaceae bacterium]
MTEIVIVSATRSAITNLGGPFRNISLADLAGKAVREAIRRAGIESNLVDHVIMGNVIQTSEAPNVARMAGLLAGIPPETFTGITLNFQCGSSLEAVNQAARLIELGECEIAVAAGVEIMSRSPFLMYNHRWGHKMGNDTLVDYFDDILTTVSTDLYGTFAVTQTAENLAQQYGINRKDADEFAVASHQKAVAAIQQGKFDDEIFSVEIPQSRGPALVISKDERPRSDTNFDKMQKLPFLVHENGTVTAGNSSGINDGTAAVVIMSRAKANELGLTPMASIRSYATAGVNPTVMGIGPVPSTRKALKKANLSMKDIGLVEVNEAFAAQALAVIKELELDLDKVNVNGGAIALGHPVGCSGTRILVTLIHEMHRRKTRFGLATLCCGGGLGVATIVENSLM